MRFTVKLFATLGQYLPPGAQRRQAEIELEAAATAGDVLASLQVPRAAAHMLLVNGVNGDWDTPVKDGDTITAFPPVAGGWEGQKEDGPAPGAS